MAMTMAAVAMIAIETSSQTARPPRRAHHALVYDEPGQRVLLTGGSTPAAAGGFTFYNDLWVFDGARWTPLPKVGDPLSGMQLAFDSTLKRVVSFGGFNERGPHGELREFDGQGWRTLGTHPTLRASEPGFVFDSRRGRFVLFGGSPGGGQASGETWELDGHRWTSVKASNPPARQGHAMVFDVSRGETVVFGGMGSGSPPQPPPSFGDTWTFDGVVWRQHKVAGPSARGAAGAAYDSKRGVVVLFGGMSTAGPLGDTWSWDGARWKKVADSGPPARAMGCLAYDKLRDRVVLFGGRAQYPNDLDDTWEWDGTSWKQVGR